MDRKIGPAFVLKARELLFLSSLLGAHYLVGLEDPFRGWLAEEIQAAWCETRIALIEQRCLAQRADGVLVMDVAVAALVGVCAFPEASFLITPASASRESIVYHARGQMAVQLTRIGDVCQLVAYTDLQDMARAWQPQLGIGAQRAAQGDTVVVSEAVLAKVRDAAQALGKTWVTHQLVQAGIEEVIATALAGALAQPESTSSLVAVAQREAGWESAALGFLQSSDGLWKLRAFLRERQHWVEAAPCDVPTAHATLTRLVHRFCR